MIEIAGSLSIDDNSYLFKDIELSLFDGGWTCLLGPSGVGKTTILRLLAHLETHGEFTGRLGAGKAAGKSTSAYMAQQDLLMPWLNVIDNVMLGARLRGEDADAERARELIARVGLSQDAHKFPRQLSGGMRQRVALARTLMEDQDLVLLDEPFSALDAKTRSEMQELAHELLVGRTVLLVTHDPAEAARLGDKIEILDEVGLRNIPAKRTRKIVDATDTKTLALQSKLLNALRRAA